MLSAEELKIAVKAYMEGLKGAYAIALALGAAALVVSVVTFVVDRRKLGKGVAAAYMGWEYKRLHCSVCCIVRFRLFC